MPLVVTSAGLTATSTNPVSEPSPAQLAFAAGSVTVNENAGNASIEAVRSGGYEGAVSVEVATTGGTGAAGVNFTSINEVLNFAAGADSQIVTIPVKDDGVATQDLTVNIALSSLGNDVDLGKQAIATLVIHNVDGSSTTSSPLVRTSGVQLITNKKQQVTEIVVGFTGGVNAADARNTGAYRLLTARKGGSSSAKVLKIRSAVYDGTNHTVALILRSPAAFKRPGAARGRRLRAGGLARQRQRADRRQRRWSAGRRRRYGHRSKQGGCPRSSPREHGLARASR